MTNDWDLTSLVAFMKAQGCTKVKMGGLEVELAPSSFTAPDTDREALAKAEAAQPSDDELMRWSAPGAFMEPEDVRSANQ